MLAINTVQCSHYDAREALIALRSTSTFRFALRALSRFAHRISLAGVGLGLTRSAVLQLLLVILCWGVIRLFPVNLTCMYASAETTSEGRGLEPGLLTVAYSFVCIPARENSPVSGSFGVATLLSLEST